MALQAIINFILIPITRLFIKALKLFFAVLYIVFDKFYTNLLPKRAQELGVLKMATYVIVCCLVIGGGAGYLMNPDVFAFLKPNNYLTGDQIVVDGLEIYKYESETLEEYDTVTEFSTMSFSSGQFEPSKDDLKTYIDSPGTDELLSLNHFGDNEPNTSDNGDWWDDDANTVTKYNWKYRKCFDIDYTAGTTDLTEHQLYLDFDTATEIAGTRMQNQGQDIRVVDTAGNVIDHYIADDINTTTTRIWIQPATITAGTTTNYCLYYGNPTATSTSSQANVFNYSSKQDLYYSLAENTQGNVIDFGSLTSSNQIEGGAYNQTYSQYQTNTIGGTTPTAMQQNSLISSKGPLQATLNGASTDSVVPISSAGTEFTYRMSAGNHNFNFVSPFCSTNIEIFNTTNLTTPVTGGTFTVAAGASFSWVETVVNAGAFANNNAVYIRSTNNCPFLVFHDGANNRTFPMFPTTTEDWYGVGSGSLELSSNTTTSLQVWNSGAASGTNITLNAANNYHTLNAGAGTQGAGPSQRIIRTSGGGFGANSINDGDGAEATTLYPRSAMGTKYFIPEAAQYVTMATIAGANTTVKIFNNGTNCNFNNPSPNQTLSANSTNDAPGFIRFGAVPQGACMVSDHPIAPYFEKSGSGDESNLFSYKQGRQKIQIEPTVTTTTAQTGSWNLGTGSTWTRRIPVTVTNNMATAVSRYPIKVNIGSIADILTNTQADGGDIRVAGSVGNGGDYKDYYLEEFKNTFSSNGELWTQVGLTPSGSTTFYIYYGATTTQTSQSNIDPIFSYTDLKPLYYIGDVPPANPVINIYSLINNNNISFLEQTYTLFDQGENYTAAGVENSTTGVVSQGGLFKSTGPLAASNRGDTTDSITPIAFAGTKFLHLDSRYEQVYNIIAPFANSTVTFERSEGSGWVPFGSSVSLTQGSLQNITRDINSTSSIGVNNAVRITSTTPIIINAAGYDNGSPISDSQLLYPVQDAFEQSNSRYELYGVSSSNLRLVTENPTTSVTITNAGGTTTGPFNVTSGTNNINSQVGVSQGSGTGMKISADGPIAAYLIADGDGIESATFLPKKEFGDTFLITTGTQYISIVSDNVGTVCTAFTNAGAIMNSVTLGSNPINHGVLGNTTVGGGVQYTKGQYVTCTNPVYAYYEKNGDGVDSNITDESNFTSFVQARKKALVEPIVTDIDDAEVLEEGLYYSSGFDMDTAAAEPEAFAEFIFDSADENVAWNNIEILESTFNNTAVTQNNVAKYKVETSAVSDSNCVTAIYPTFTEAIVSEPLDKIELPENTSDKNCIKIRLTLRTGDLAHSPIIDKISLSYTNPVLLEDVTSLPVITVDGSDEDFRQRILKYKTSNLNLTGSESYLRHMDNSNNSVFSNFELDLYDINSETNLNMFNWPAFPSTEIDSTNTLSFDDSVDAAVYLKHDRTLSTGSASVDLALRVDILNNSGTLIDREFQVVINQ